MGRIIQSVYDMCRGRLLVQHKGYFSSVQTCQNSPVSGEKMLPLAPASCMLVVCLTQCTIDEQSPVVSSRSPGCQSCSLQAGRMQKNAVKYSMQNHFMVDTDVKEGDMFVYI